MVLRSRAKEIPIFEFVNDIGYCWHTRMGSALRESEPTHVTIRPHERGKHEPLDRSRSVVGRFI
eukprot:6198686-Pleurochrysis_carterae.AAC.1